MAHIPGCDASNCVKNTLLRIRKYERAFINDSGDMYLSIKDFRDSLISVNRL